jgi:Rad3-related DNA helicase
MPYNYLIDPKIRENFKISYENSVIIMDEAHNIEKVAEDVASFEIKISMLNAVVGELSHLINAIECNSEAKTFLSSNKNVVEILTMTRNFQAYIRDFDILNSKRMPISEIRDEDGVYPGT